MQKLNFTRAVEDEPEQQPCQLLDLPAELREAIYTCIFFNSVNPDELELDISVDRLNSSQPALLQTCRQLRDEASKLFFATATFYLNIQDLKMEPQPHHWIWTKAPAAQFKIGNEGTTHFDDLVVWLQKVHAGQLDIDNFIGLYDEICEVWEDVFEMVDEVKGLEWEQAERVLRCFARSLNRVGRYGFLLENHWGPA